MTLTELRYIVALAKERHFGRAAKACHVSQPTLSVAISKLENQLSVAIFERQIGAVSITEIGEKIVAQAQRVLEESDQIKDIADAGRYQLNYPLRIGAIYTVAPYLFPRLIPSLKKIAPDMPLIVEEDFTANLRLKLQRGALDVIFIALPFDEPGVLTKSVYDEDFVVLMQKDHPLSKKSAIAAGDLQDENVLLLGEGHCFRDQVIEACPRCYHPNETQQTVMGTSLETIRHMVASGMGITILPGSATQVQYYKSLLCTRPFAGKVPNRTIALAWRVSFPRTKVIDAIMKALKTD